MQNIPGKLKANSLRLRMLLIAFPAVIPVLVVMVFPFGENQHLVMHITIDVIYLVLVLAAFAILMWKGGELVLFKPLNALTRAARRLADGDMGARVDLVCTGETGELARAFADMADSLETGPKKLYAIIEGLPVFAWVQSLDYTIRLANRSFIQSLGDPGNKHCYEFFHNKSEICANCRLATTLQTQKPGSFELNFANGKILEVYQSFFPDIDGCPLVLRMGIDITGKKAVEEEIIRLDRLNLVGEMAATIAHEIRNPLTTVRGFLQMLEAKNEGSGYSDYYNLMIDELDRANSIIMEYLSLTRITRTIRESCNLNDLIRQIYPLIASDAAGLCLNVKTDLWEIPSLALNKKEIRQLLLNLVRNGLEAMNEGGTLTISTFAEGDRVVLAVRDQGGGVDPAILNRLGTPFVTTKEKGTGLGLPVCYAIADRNSAEISVESGSGGTIFQVGFKVRPA